MTKSDMDKYVMGLGIIAGTVSIITGIITLAKLKQETDILRLALNREYGDIAPTVSRDEDRYFDSSIVQRAISSTGQRVYMVPTRTDINIG